MGDVVRLHPALASTGHRSGRNSDRNTPVASSILGANSAGTPRLERVSQYQTWDCVVPMRSAKGFWPPAIEQARLSASVDMRAQYPDLGKNQPRNLSGTTHLDFSTFLAMGMVDKVAFGARVRARRDKLGITGKQLAEAVGMKQQGVNNIEQGLVERPRRLLELAKALQTTQEWLLYGDGPEDLKPANPLEEMLALVRDVAPDKAGLAIEFLRGLRDDASDKVA